MDALRRPVNGYCLQWLKGLATAVLWFDDAREVDLVGLGAQRAIW